jgi:hypothetical protein
MIQEQRDAAFWREIASDPAVAGAVMGLTPDQIAEIAARPAILPLASANGGFFFGTMDGLGLIAELHSLYRPAGRGREAAEAGRKALERVFATFQVVVTYEVQGNERSRPPRSFGFVMAGDWRETAVGVLRAWVLTRAAWEGSPVKRRMATCRLHS